MLWSPIDFSLSQYLLVLWREVGRERWLIEFSMVLDANDDFVLGVMDFPDNFVDRVHQDDLKQRR